MPNPESIQPTRPILEEEIHSQPALLAQFLAREGAHIAGLSGITAGCDYVVIAARGSSDHAAIYASYLFAQLAGLPVSLATPALYSLYHTPPRLRGALVLGISQSGQSPDIVAVLREARAQGRPTLAITNDPASPLALTADHVIALGTGVERSVAATKTYTTQLLAVAALAAAWSGRADAQAALADIGAAAARTLTLADTRALAARLAAANRCIVVGRGYGFPTALEWALKLKELTGIQAAAYSAADFRHGPISSLLTQPGEIPVVLIAQEGPALADMRDLAAQLQEQKVDAFVVGNAGPLASAHALIGFDPGAPEWLTPILSILPGQLAALQTTLLLGRDVDRPLGLNKVTLTQ